MSNDPPKKNLHFQDEQEFPFNLLSDQGMEMAVAYGAAENREDKAANRISYLIGPDRVVLKVYSTVKPAEHPEQVLNDIP